VATQAGQAVQETQTAPAAPPGMEGVARTSYVRAGATCLATRGRGPGIPYANDVSEAFRHALQIIDEEGRVVGSLGSHPGTPSSPGRVPSAALAAGVTGTSGKTDASSSALDLVLAEARASDAITLWHLLARVDGLSRDRVFERLAAMAPPPVGVTREGIRAGDRVMLERWWEGARLGPPLRWLATSPTSPPTSRPLR
jgi:hypothetical protein